MSLRGKQEGRGRDTVSADSKNASTQRRGRQFPRVKVSVPVTVVARMDEIKGSIVDLSLSGAFILLPELPDTSRPLRLIIDLPGSHILVLTAEGVRFEICPGDDGGRHLYGLAVRFLSLSSEDRLVFFKILRI